IAFREEIVLPARAARTMRGRNRDGLLFEVFVGGFQDARAFPGVDVETQKGVKRDKNVFDSAIVAPECAYFGFSACWRALRTSSGTASPPRTGTKPSPSATAAWAQWFSEA